MWNSDEVILFVTGVTAQNNILYCLSYPPVRTRTFPALCTVKSLGWGRTLWGLGSESLSSSKYELQGSLDVTLCGLQRPEHQLLILDPHVPELLHLGLPAALAEQNKS